MLGWIIAFYIALLSAFHYFPHTIKPLSMLIFGITLIHLTGMTILIIWMYKRIKKIQIEDGTYSDSLAWKNQAYQNLAKLRKGQIYGGYAGSVFGSICWMLVISIMANDWFTAVLIIIAAGLIYAVSTYYCIRNPIRYYKIAIWICFYIYLLTAAAILFRWEIWKKYFYITGTYSRYYISSRIEVILGLLVFYSLLVLLFHYLILIWVVEHL